jgi:hypothetical protein
MRENVAWFGFGVLNVSSQVDLGLGLQDSGSQQQTERERTRRAASQKMSGYSSFDELPNSLNFFFMVSLPEVSSLIVILFAASEAAPR